jgi:hypothetical protein
MTAEQAITDLTERVERGCGADVLIGQLGAPVVVRTTGPGKNDYANYDITLGTRLAKHLNEVLRVKYDLAFNVSGTILGTRVLSYTHTRYGGAHG